MKRKDKILGAQQFKQLTKNGNGRKRSRDDLLDSYRTIMRKILRGRW